MNDQLQDHRLDALEANQREIMRNQQAMQTRLAVMQATLDRMATDHEAVAVLKERVSKIERLLYGALALGTTAVVGLLIETAFVLARGG